jgi:hypothetical protein
MPLKRLRQCQPSSSRSGIPGTTDLGYAPIAVKDLSYASLVIMGRFRVFCVFIMWLDTFEEYRLLGRDATRRPCGSCKNRRIASIIMATRIGELGMRLAVYSYVFQLLITANVVPSSPILVAMMMETIRSSETSVLTRATWHHIPKDGILRSVLKLLVTANIVPSSPILVTLMMEAILPSKRRFL